MHIRLTVLSILAISLNCISCSSPNDNIEISKPRYFAQGDNAGEFSIPQVLPLNINQLELLRKIVADDTNAAALAETAKHQAGKFLNAQPHPLKEIHYAGLVHNNPLRIETVKNLREMAHIAYLVRHWQVSGDPKTAETLRNFIVAWTDTYVITGNDVNENKFWPLLVAYDGLRMTFTDAKRKKIDQWVSELGKLHAGAVENEKAVSNRYTKHVRLTAMAGRILGHEKWIAAAHEGVRRFVRESLFPDGTSMDLKRRDTLTYHASSLRPAIELAILSEHEGMSLYFEKTSDGSSLGKSVNYVVPYALGTKTRTEWTNSSVKLDKRRAEAELEEYKPGKLYDPQSALPLMELASYFDKRLLKVVCHLKGSESNIKYPTWQTLINASAKALSDDEKAQMKSTLEKLDRQFDDSFDWWAKVYDSKSGGCFYSLSAKQSAPTDKRFAPDIEATSKLVGVLEWTNLLEGCPESFKRGIVRYLQGLQDPDSGFFRNPQHIEHYNANLLERAAGMATGTLRKCGGEPLYPLPIERTKNNADAAAHYKKLESVENLRNWLDELPWDSFAWRAGSSIRALSGTFQKLPEPKRTQLLDALEKYVYEKQADNGFFGTDADSWYSRLSGTYKTASFLVGNGREIPRADKIAESVLYHLHNTNYTNSIVLYNTINILNILHYNGANFDLEKRIEIVNCCIDILQKMKAPDGAFVTHTDRPTPVEMGLLMSKDVVESNTNASGLMHISRNLLIQLLTGQSGPHPHPKGIDLINSLKTEN